MQASIDTRVTLNNGVRIPLLGLGVFRASSGGEAARAVRWALELGYRHIDTAAVYGNEADVGLAIRESGIPREDIFVTTKLWNADHGYEQAIKACEESLRKLGLDHVDLYLVHWPLEGVRAESWRALETLLSRGKCRAIGVSNYMARHVEEVLRTGAVVPAVNQFELHPFLYPKETITLCKEKGIAVEAYSPLTKGKRLDHPAITGMARKYGRSAAQILIRWSIEHGFVVLPKSVKKERIAENAAVFDFSLAPEDLAALDALDEGLHTAWDPTGVP